MQSFVNILVIMCMKIVIILLGFVGTLSLGLVGTHIETEVMMMLVKKGKVGKFANA